MKRILLSAIAAVCIGALTSCVNELDYTDDIQNENYTKAFVKQFGKVDPSHDWGFAPASASRTVSRDGEGSNIGDPEWLTYVSQEVIDVNAEKWKNPPLIKDWERIAVMNYLHSHPGPGGKAFPADKPFFVTQVGNCHALANGSNGLTQHGNYTSLNGDTGVSSSNMNNLHVGLVQGCDVEYLNGTSSNGSATDWAHVNNFNAGENTNYNGNTVVSGKGHGGGYDFAYHNSVGNKYYNNYKIIPGSEIDYRLSAYHYLCFDYEAYKSMGGTKFHVVYYKSETQGMDLSTKYEQGAGLTAEIIEAAMRAEGKTFTRVVSWEFQSNNNDHTQILVTYLTEHSRNDVSVNGYYKNGVGVTKAQIEAGLQSLDSFYEVGEYTFTGYDKNSEYIEADGIYDDWVIRLCGDAICIYDDRIPIYPHEDYESYRIFVEDLAVLTNNDFVGDDSDWDFNDVVFDVKYIAPKAGETEGKIQVALRALGGQLPVYFCGPDNEQGKPTVLTQELHTSWYGVSTKTMVNTDPNGAKHDPVVRYFSPSDFGIDVSQTTSVTVNFQQGAQTYHPLAAAEFNKVRVFVEVNGTLREMRAGVGQAPSKLCVPSYLAAPQERKHITIPYPRFDQYVQDKNINFWEAPVSHTGN